MLYQVTCNTIPSADIAHYGVSRVEDLGIWEMYCNFCLLRYFFIKGENLRIRHERGWLGDSDAILPICPDRR